MVLFLKVYFWIGVVSLLTKIVVIGVGEFPRKREDSLGFYISVVLLQLPFVLWAAYLIWA